MRATKWGITPQDNKRIRPELAGNISTISGSKEFIFNWLWFNLKHFHHSFDVFQYFNFLTESLNHTSHPVGMILWSSCLFLVWLIMSGKKRNYPNEFLNRGFVNTPSFDAMVWNDIEIQRLQRWLWGNWLTSEGQFGRRPKKACEPLVSTIKRVSKKKCTRYSKKVSMTEERTGYRSTTTLTILSRFQPCVAPGRRGQFEELVSEWD